MTEGAWALLGVIVGTVGTGIVSWLLQSRQFRHDKEMGAVPLSRETDLVLS
jgi:hypothetical protein